MTISELIDQAGGPRAVAKRLHYTLSTVRNWKYGYRLPGSAGRLRSDLCRMAGVTMEDVSWELERDKT